jgi:hypothetical protein
MNGHGDSETHKSQEVHVNADNDDTHGRSLECKCYYNRSGTGWRMSGNGFYKGVSMF